MTLVLFRTMEVILGVALGAGVVAAGWMMLCGLR
jgi:hypothetical protein